MQHKERGNPFHFRRMRSTLLFVLLTVVPIGLTGAIWLTGPIGPLLLGETLPVRHIQGTMHGFLIIRSLEGTILAVGDVTAVPHADRVVSRLTFHFRDGSIDDETTIYSQRGVFRLISDHHIQKGPSFPKPINIQIEASGQITSRSIGDGGKEKIQQDHLNLPPDISNGLIPTLLENIRVGAGETKVSMVASTAKPRMVTLSIKPEGWKTFSVGGVRRKAMDFRIKVELGGLTGVVAPLIGKEPADTHVWILGGKTPAFIRELGQLYQGGPMVSIEQTSPEFSQVGRRHNQSVKDKRPE